MLERSGVEVVQAPDAVFAAMSPGSHTVGPRCDRDAAPCVGQRGLLGVECARARRDRRAGSGQRRRARAHGGSWRHERHVRERARPPIRFRGRRFAGAWVVRLRLPVVGGMPTASVMTCLRSGGIRSIAAVPRGGEDPDAIDWRGKVALIVGGEGAGLPDEVTRHCDALVSIPMAARVESLNVAAAGAILVYAARRQRG